MKKTYKIILTTVVGVAGLLSFASLAFASPFDYITSYRDATDTSTTTVAVHPFATSPGTNSVIVLVGNDDSSQYRSFNLGSGIGVSTGTNNLYVTPNTIETTDGFLIDTLNKKLNSDVYTTGISNVNDAMSALSASLNISTFMGNNASTSPFIASSTKNGFLSTTDKSKLDAMAANLPWSWSTPSRSIVTGTGATGFQVSSTRNATIRENVTVTTTASIAGNAGGYITLEMAPTNSATAGDWVEVGRCGNSQALTLAITLQSVQGTTCELTADVPAGYYSKLRSVTSTGTVTFAFVSAQEVLK